MISIEARLKAFAERHRATAAAGLVVGRCLEPPSVSQIATVDAAFLTDFWVRKQRMPPCRKTLDVIPNPRDLHGEARTRPPTLEALLWPEERSDIPSQFSEAPAISRAL